MTVKVLFFAMLCDHMRCREMTCDIKNGETVGELADRILLGFDTPLCFAVNCAYVPREYRLQAGDEVAFIPPVAGG